MCYEEGLPKRSGESDGLGVWLNNRKLRIGSGPAPPAQLLLSTEGQEINQRRHQTSEPPTVPLHTLTGQRDRDRQGMEEDEDGASMDGAFP